MRSRVSRCQEVIPRRSPVDAEILRIAPLVIGCKQVGIADFLGRWQFVSHTQPVKKACHQLLIGNRSEKLMRQALSDLFYWH